MITVNQSKDIIVKDVPEASFTLKYKHKDKIYTLDLNPSNYLKGGSLSTGMFFTDMALYTLDRMNKILSSISENLITFIDLKSSVIPGNQTVEFYDIEFSKNFEVLLGVPYDMFWLKVFMPAMNTVISKQEGLLSVKRIENLNLNMNNLLNLMYRLFLYSASQKVRDTLTACACKVFSDSYYNKGIGFSKVDNSVLVFNKYIDDYVAVEAPKFMPKLVYPLSCGNSSVSSYGDECVGHLDLYQLFKTGGFDIGKRNHLEVSSDTCILTVPKIQSFTHSNRNNKKVFNISGYKTLDGVEDYLIGATIYADYDCNLDVSEAVCCLFNEPQCEPSCNASLVFQSDLIKLTYDDIVFDKDIDDIINNDHIKIGMRYTGFTKSGGGRLYSYDTLSNKKISPTSRRDLLNDTVLNILRTAGINKIKFFKQLDVDFKRFYGFIKK